MEVIYERVHHPEILDISISIFILFILIIIITKSIKWLKPIILFGVQKAVSHLIYMFSIDTDFILKIAPQKNSSSKRIPKAYYPPPNYGFPYNKRVLLDGISPPRNYHMFLAPGGLNKWYFGMTSGISCIAFFPLIIYWAFKDIFDPYSIAIYTIGAIFILLPLIFHRLFTGQGCSILKTKLNF